MVRARLAPSQRKRLRQLSASARLKVPAPVGGWNTRDDEADMLPLDAIVLDNWFPDTNNVRVRNGRAAFGTGAGSGDVPYLAAFEQGADQQLVAGAGLKLYNFAAAGAGVEIGTGFANNNWHSSQFNNNLFLVNDADGYRRWDGTTLTTPAFTGPTAANVKGVHNYRNRLFFWESNSGDFWYADVNALTGTLTLFQTSQVTQKGGNILAMATLSRDGGSGPDDFLAIFYTTGEILIYLGNNPGDATAWGKIGNYFIAPLTSPMSAVEIAGDVICQTITDYVFLNKVITEEATELASKASGAITAAWKSGSSLSGWGGVLFPAGKMVIFNIPISNGKFEQHVASLIGGEPRWCRYLDHQSLRWAVMGRNVFFGSDGGKVTQAETSQTDEGTEIDALAKTAWNDLGSIKNKIITGFRSIIRSQGAVNYEFGLGFDFVEAEVDQPLSVASVGTPWPSPWGSPWSPASQVNSDWRGAAGMGTAISVGMRVRAKQVIRWIRTDLNAVLGGK